MTGGYACCASCALHLQAAAGGAQKPGIGQQAASPPEAAANNRPPRQRPWSPIDSPIVHHNDAQQAPALGENRLTHQKLTIVAPLVPFDRPFSSTAQQQRRPPRPCSVQGVKCTTARLAMSPPSWPLSSACAGKWPMARMSGAVMALAWALISRACWPLSLSPQTIPPSPMDGPICWDA